jgi:hypothetical protein
MRDAVIAFAVLAVLMIGGRFLLRRRAPGAVPLHVPAVDGTFTLMPPRRIAFMLGATALAPAAVLGVVTYQGRHAGGLGFYAGIAATLLAVGVAAYLFASAARSRLVVRDTGIERFGVFRHRLMGWTSVAKIAFNPLEHWFFITMSDGSRLWVPSNIPGIGDFARLALRRVRPAVLDADGPMVRDVLSQLAGLAHKGPRAGTG